MAVGATKAVPLFRLGTSNLSGGATREGLPVFSWRTEGGESSHGGAGGGGGVSLRDAAVARGSMPRDCNYSSGPSLGDAFFFVLRFLCGPLILLFFFLRESPCCLGRVFCGSCRCFRFTTPSRNITTFFSH